MGDVKLLAMIGAFLGWKLVLLTLVMASLSGSIIGVALIASKRGNMKYALPFGTFLAIGAVVSRRLGHADRGLVLRLLSMSLQAYALLANTAIIVAGDRRHRVRRAPLPVGLAQEPRSQSRRRRVGAAGGRPPGRDSEAAAQERAMTERAEASELLSTQIVNSLTAGLLVVDRIGPGADPEPRRTTDARVRCGGRVAALHEVAGRGCPAGRSDRTNA